MSSSTSNSSPHRRYLLGLVGIVVLPAYCLLAVGAYLQPLYGDLTRTGAFAEKDYGWNNPQREFHRPLSYVGRYDHYYDVIVLGDSFSTSRPHAQWQNYVVAATGWSLLTLDVNKVNLPELLASPVFRSMPPKVLIYQAVERALPWHIRDEPPCGTITFQTQVGAQASSRHAPTIAHAEDVLAFTKHVDRETSWNEVKLKFVLRYLRNSILRDILGDLRADVVEIALARQAPFSSTIKHSMLIYREDIQKTRNWRDMGLAEISCRIAQLRSRIESNGVTRFVFLAAPDKLTAYADFVTDQHFRDRSVLASLCRQHPDLMPRLDLALISAIRQGKQDVYLPDDTHWGSTGYQIVAETLLRFLHLHQ